MTTERYAVDVDLLKQANLNTVHPFCVVEKQAFYDQCDQAGVLVYQDFPMWLMMNNSSDLVRRASAQMRDLILQFGHHPCIGIWNCGSQPSVANFEKLGAALAHTARELDPTRIVHQANALVDVGTQDELPDDPIGKFHWTERVMRDFEERFDWRVDTHQYRGWYWERMEDLASVPLEHLQLVTEYGAQGLPSAQTLQRMLPDAALFPPVWSFYTRRCFQPEYQFLFIPQPQSLEQFVKDSQTYQARFIQYHTEYYRRHKFRPCNGAHLFCFNDCWPAITWSVVDYYREPKAGFYALQRAMAPLQALLELEEEIVAGVETKAVAWLVNDFPREFTHLTLRWSISGQSSGELGCSIAPNDLHRVGELRWVFESPGSYTVDLQLLEEDRPVAENRYVLTVKSSSARYDARLTREPDQNLTGS
jgi:beta-mannosidase